MIALALLRLAAAVFMVMTLSLVVSFAARPQIPLPLLLRLHVETESSVRLLDLESGRDLRLKEVAFPGTSLLWSPDGRWLAYEDAEGALYLYDLIAGRNHRLMSGEAATPGFVNWSPDGRRLLLQERTVGELRYIAFEDDGFSAPQRLDNGLGGALWSPDGTRLYYRDFLNVPGVIAADCLDPGADCVRALVPTERPIIQLAGWMPDAGEMMALSPSDEDGSAELYSLNPDTGEMRFLLGDLLPGVVPVWSPDGSALAASLAVPSDDGDDDLSEPIPGVYLIDRTMERRTLVWTGIAGQLGWTPQGDRLAFELISRVGNDRSVWLYDRTNGEVTTVTPSGAFEVLPSWGVFGGRRFEIWGVLAVFGGTGAFLYFSRPR